MTIVERKSYHEKDMIIRRIFPELIKNDIVNIQPMETPRSLWSTNILWDLVFKKPIDFNQLNEGELIMAAKLIKFKKQPLDEFYTNGEEKFYFKLFNKFDKELGIVDNEEFEKMKEIIADKQLALLYVRADNETVKRFANFIVENFKNEIVLQETK